MWGLKGPHRTRPSAVNAPLRQSFAHISYKASSKQLWIIILTEIPFQSWWFCEVLGFKNLASSRWDWFDGHEHCLAQALMSTTVKNIMLLYSGIQIFSKSVWTYLPYKIKRSSGVFRLWERKWDYLSQLWRDNFFISFLKQVRKYKLAVSVSFGIVSLEMFIATKARVQYCCSRRPRPDPGKKLYCSMSAWTNHKVSWLHCQKKAFQYF